MLTAQTPGPTQPPTVGDLPEIPIEWEWVKDAQVEGEAYIAVKKKLTKHQIDNIKRRLEIVQEAVYSRDIARIEVAWNNAADEAKDGEGIGPEVTVLKIGKYQIALFLL